MSRRQEGASDKILDEMRDHITRAAESLPPLGCFGRDRASNKPPHLPNACRSPGNSASGMSAPITRVAKPGGALVRRTTPTTPNVPVERAFLRGGAREQTTVSTRGYASTLDQLPRPSGAGAGRLGSREQVGSRGTLGAGRAVLTPPAGRTASRPGGAVRQSADRATPPPSSTTDAVCCPVAPPATAPPANSSSSSGGELKCDACDGKHATDKCPYFKGKPRDKHPDAKRASEKKMLGMQSGPVEILRHGSARVVRQPGDGSCLFHSMCYGLKDGSNASGLRREVAKFIENNPSLTISDSPLKDWVQWDSGTSVGAYARRMSTGGVWGGGIEMAAVSHMRRVNVFVYQAAGGGYKRISSFESPSAGGGAKPKTVRVLYGGGVHYDALEATDP